MSTREPFEPPAPPDEAPEDGGAPEDGPTDGGAPNDRLTAGRSSVPSLHARAKVQVANRQYADAIQACRHGLLQDPAQTDLRMLLGMSLLALGRHDEARAEMRAILSQDPHHAAAHRLLGEGYLRDGQPEQARSILRRTLELEPEDNEARELLTEVEGEEHLRTIDRWFDPANLATKQSSSPPWVSDPDTSPEVEASDLPAPATKVEQVYEVEALNTPAPATQPPSCGEDGSMLENSLADSSLPEENLSTLASQLEALAEQGLPPLQGDPTIARASVFSLPEEERTGPNDPLGAGSEPLVPDLTAASGVPVLAAEALSQRVHAGGSAGSADVKNTGAKKPGRSFFANLILAVTLVLAGLVGVGLAVLAIQFASTARSDEEVRLLLEEACKSGSGTSLLQAIELGDEKLGETAEATALRARMLAMATLEQRERRHAMVKRLLQQLTGTLPNEGRAATDAAFARAYLALDEGALREAKKVLSRAAGSELDPGELAHLRAVTALRAGEWDNAQAEAARALKARPGAPRTIAVLGLALFEQGSPARALEVFGQSADTAHSPLLDAARARVLFDAAEASADSRRQALQLASDLIAGGEAGPIQQAEAHLLRSRAYVASGSQQDARGEARKALELSPRGDERFLLQIGETFLAAGDRTAAQSALRLLPEEAVQRGRRARLAAEVAVAQGQFKRLGPTIAALGEGAQEDFLRGRHAEAKGEYQAATRFYEAAKADPEQTVRSVAGLARIALAEDRVEDALAILAPAYEQAPDSPSLATLYMEALMRGDGGPSKAQAVLAAATRLRPNAPSLLRAQAALATAQGQDRIALDAWAAFLQHHPDDMDGRIAYGLVAERAGEWEIARESFEAVLADAPENEQALVGSFRLALVRGDWPEAETRLAPLGDPLGEPPDGQLNGAAQQALRAQLGVARGDGALLARSLESQPALGRDPILLQLFGEALYQAEDDLAAERAYKKSLDLEANRAGPLLGLAQLSLRRGNAARAADRLAQAEAALEESRGATRPGEMPQRGVVFRAFFLAVAARVAFETGDFTGAKERAAEALRLDSQCSHAHFVRGELAVEAGKDPLPHYRAAADGRAPPPEALAQLALRLSPAEGCPIAKRFLQRAPSGIDARAMRALMHRCDPAPAPPTSP